MDRNEIWLRVEGTAKKNTFYIVRIRYSVYSTYDKIRLGYRISSINIIRTFYLKQLIFIR